MIRKSDLFAIRHVLEEELWRPARTQRELRDNILYFYIKIIKILFIHFIEKVYKYMELIMIPEKKIEQWEDIEQEFKFRIEDPTEWIFRGEDGEFPLATSLERALLIWIGKKLVDKKNCKEQKSQFQISPDEFDEELKKLSKIDIRLHKIEYALIREFKRKCKNYSIQIPDDNHIIEWLSLLRHHGAPTRLLDWTYSPYVALFFALEKAVNKCIIYEINYDKLKDFAKEKFIWYNEYLMDETSNRERIVKDNLFIKEEPYYSYVFPLTPFYFNNRITIQRGTFLGNTNLSVSFYTCLMNTLAEKKDIAKKYIIELKTHEVRYQFLQHLWQMNINYSTLLPGLDGFAKDLGVQLIFPKSKQNWKS